MKSARYVVCILLCLFPCLLFAGDNFFDKMVIDLLKDKVNDERIIISTEYNSSAKLKKIIEQQDKINEVVLETFDPKYSSFRVKIKYNHGGIIDTISGKYHSYVNAPVAARYIKFGDIIQSSDISVVKIAIDNVQNGYVSSESEVIGMQAKKYIASGAMIKTSDIASPPVIKNNDPVNITYSAGAINLKTTGIALGSGAIGDMIKVKNNSSGAVLLGQIINKNTVQVGGE